MSKKPTIVTLAAVMLIISATFASRTSASTGGNVPTLQAVSVAEKENTQSNKTGKRKKEFQGVGTVAAVSGTTLTILGKDNTLYVVDAASASVKKGGRYNASLKDIRSGDKLFVRGEVVGSKSGSVEIFE